MDTNVISETRKGSKANSGVRSFLLEIDQTLLYIPAQTVGEIRRGIENIRHRGDVSQARLIEAWLAEILTQFTDRILSFDLDCAQVWGTLMSPNPQHPVDKQIAAIALINNMTVVTRNAPDFASSGVRVHNPFS